MNARSCCTFAGVRLWGVASLACVLSVSGPASAAPDVSGAKTWDAALEGGAGHTWVTRSVDGGGLGDVDRRSAPLLQLGVRAGWALTESWSVGPGLALQRGLGTLPNTHQWHDASAIAVGRFGARRGTVAARVLAGLGPSLVLPYFPRTYRTEREPLHAWGYHLFIGAGVQQDSPSGDTYWLMDLRWALHRSAMRQRIGDAVSGQVIEEDLELAGSTVLVVIGVGFCR